MNKESLLSIENLSVSIADNKILKGINLNIYKNNVTSILGPSGCGKTTLLRCFNRMNDYIPSLTYSGSISLHNENIFNMNPVLLRQKIGMVFQRPNPFPNLSIYQNVLAGYLLNGIKLSKEKKNSIVENSLSQAGLWDEVKDSLHRKGTFLSGGQQQRLCIARALALNPEVILLDEPTSALDPFATTKIEELISDLKSNVTVIIVTHNIAQASRVSDFTAFMYLGDLIEYNPTEKMFKSPDKQLTEEYLRRKFG